ADISSARVFSDNSKKRWKEFPTPKQVPENQEWSAIAYVWTKAGSPAMIDVEGIGEDFADSTYYCFNASGDLTSSSHEFRTAWDWGLAEDMSFDRAEKKTAKSHFFSTKDHKEIARPDGADDVAEAMKVKMYQRLSVVPFFTLLGKR